MLVKYIAKFIYNIMNLKKNKNIFNQNKLKKLKIYL